MEQGQIQSWFWIQKEIWELCAFEMSVDSFVETLLGFAGGHTMKWNLWETFFGFYFSVKTFNHLISNLSISSKWLQQQQAWQSELTDYQNKKSPHNSFDFYNK